MKNFLLLLVAEDRAERGNLLFVEGHDFPCTRRRDFRFEKV